MERRLKITGPARSGLKKIGKYICESFGKERGELYLVEVKNHIQLIHTNPYFFEQYLIGDSIEVRRSVFQKMTIILNTVTDDLINIIAIKDSRSNWKPNA